MKNFNKIDEKYLDREGRENQWKNTYGYNGRDKVLECFCIEHEYL
ncbi:MAG: hypothetical protein ACK41Q_09150 [Candidatus Brocadia sp.]